MKIRTRIILSFVVLVGIGFYFLVHHILAELRPRYLEAVEEVLVDEANLLATFLESQMTEGQIPVAALRRSFQELGERNLSAQIYKLHKTHVDERVYVTDAQGVVLFDSEGRDEGKDFSQWRDVYLTLRGEYGARTTRNDVGDPTTSILHVAAPIRYRGETVGVLTLGKPTASINFFIQTATPSIVISGAVAALSVILLGALLSTWVTHPIRRLTRYARSVGEGKDVPLPKLDRSEIGEMGAAFEGMREALEGKNYVESYVQSLTHELKSPIAAVQGAAEILVEQGLPPTSSKFAENIRAEASRMHQIVERMLELSSLESRRGLQDVEAVDMTELVGQVLSRWRDKIEIKALRLEDRRSAGVQVRGERFLLEAAVQNLLQNAVEFSPRGGTLGLELKEEGNKISFELRDEGPGIPDYALLRVFDRFYSLPRPDTGRKSSGLGLSFVRAVARLHGGEVELKNLKPIGAVAILTLARRPHEVLD